MSLGAEIRARMSLDSSGVKAGVAQANGHVGGFNDSLKNMAGTLGIAFGAGAVVSGIKSLTSATMDMAGRAKDMADQTGLSIGQFQAFSAEAMLVSGGLKAAENGLVTFRAAQDEALNGNKTTIEAFAKLGISLEDIANKSTPQLLDAVSKGYKSIGNFGALVDIFGKKNAAKLEQALISVADNGLGALEKKAKDAGVALSDEMVAQLDSVGDSADKLLLKMQVFWAKMLVPAITWAKKATAVLGSVLYDMFDQNRDYTFKEMVDHAKEAAGDVTAEIKKEEQARLDAKKKTEKLEADLRQTQVDKIYGDEADALDELKKKQADDAKKLADEKAAEAARDLEKKKDVTIKTLDDLTQKTADAAGVSVTELKGAGAAQFQQRFDSLRQIGANVLGSGVIRPAAVDREAEIATATRQTAENTARLVQKLDAAPVSRLAASTAVF
jgi:hypothetical protein